MYILKKNQTSTLVSPGVLAKFYCRTDKIFRIELLLHPFFDACIFGADSGLTKKIKLWIEAYSKKILPDIDLPLLWPTLSPFQKGVIFGLKDVSFGTTLSYKDLAERLGHPKAYRAVGVACGRNPFPLILPCHRIVNAKSGLGGFSQGIEVKKALLEHER